MICRYADDFVCAFQLKDDAERFYQGLPIRLKKFGLEVAPEKTQIVRFSRFHPNMERGFTFLGFEFYCAALGLIPRPLGRSVVSNECERS